MIKFIKYLRVRLRQYEAYFNFKGVEVALSFANKRAESEISMMEKYALDTSKLECARSISMIQYVFAVTRAIYCQ